MTDQHNANTPRTIPTVQATYTTNGTGYRVMCPHCFSVHVHGPQAGHKVAHFDPGTPGKSVGYFIKPPLDEQEVA